MTPQRSSVQPNTGLWSLQARLEAGHNGAIVHHFVKPVDLQNFDTVSASIMHVGSRARSGEWRAAVFLVDASGKRVAGDAFPVTAQWKALPLDLPTAAGEGLDVGHVSAIGVDLRRAGNEDVEPLDVRTDSWCVSRNQRAYIGARLGAPKSFYAQRDGTRLTVGRAGQYEITFFQRSGTERPWMTVTQMGGGGGTLGNPVRRMVLGQPGTGLMLLDQDRYDAISAGVRQDTDEAGALRNAGAVVHPPTMSWPVTASASSVWSWECTWASPVAVIVEVRQEVGPYDRLGEAAVVLKWRFMIYQWGQVFVHAEWTKRGAAEGGGRRGMSDPISWALVSDQSAQRTDHAADIQANGAGDAERLLSAIYPASVRSGAGVLPHQMQTNAAVAMIAKTGGGKSNWWWGAGKERKIFGVGIAARGAGEAGAVDCMLLVDGPSALMEAGSFSQYLVPPKVRVRQGELDRNFPGDFDNDGLVEPYGFQVVRLANARTSFMIYPQERPLFYPAFLFTVPAVEREADDVKNSRMVINIDGQQFADPPAFPDGSFLLQMPYVIDRPVRVEAVLVRK